MTNRMMTSIEIVPDPGVKPISHRQQAIELIAGFLRSLCAHQRRIGVESAALGLPVLEHQQVAIGLAEELLNRIVQDGATLTYPDLSDTTADRLFAGLLQQHDISDGHTRAYQTFLDEHHDDKGDETDERDLLIRSTFHTGLCHGLRLAFHVLDLEFDVERFNDVRIANGKDPINV